MKSFQSRLAIDLLMRWICLGIDGYLFYKRECHNNLIVILPLIFIFASIIVWLGLVYFVGDFMFGRLSGFVCFLLILSNSLAASSVSLDQKIGVLLEGRDRGTHTAVWVNDLSSDKLIYQYNDHHSLLPASTQKFITAIGAWLALGSNWRYQTKLYTMGGRSKSLLKGDVVIKFSGDPTLTTKDLKKLLLHLKQAGITKIRGKVKLDISAFSPEPYPKGLMWDDLTECFAVPMSAAVLDRNCIQFKFKMKPNYKQPKVYVYPENVVTLSKQMTTKTKVGEGCLLHIIPRYNNHYTLSGCVPKKKQVWSEQVAVWDEKAYLLKQTTLILKKLGIRVSKGVHLSSYPVRIKSYRKSWIHSSSSLRSLIEEMLKVSDNLIANSLFRTVGLKRFGHGVTWHQASFALREVLAKKLGIRWPERSLHDGSGLSLYNRVDASTMGTVLLKVYQNKSLRKQIMPLLAVAGVDGTLRWRFKKSPVKNRFFAKTGTLSGVSGLVGYLHTKKGHWLAVVILTQGQINQKYAYRWWEDDLVGTLYRNV